MKALSICIAGIHIGCEKTTVSLGIMSALGKRGLSRSLKALGCREIASREGSILGMGFRS